MVNREDVLAIIRANTPLSGDAGAVINDETALSEIGLTSLHLVTLLLTFQQQYGLDINGAIASGMPATMGELISMILKEQNA